MTTTEPALRRIQDVADEVGLTSRSIRYYESIGLLAPAARSEGDYRLYDEHDVERLRFIKRLRDDAGFSLAEIGQLLEDEAARRIDRERLQATTDPAERRAILEAALGRVERQIGSLEEKRGRLASMVTAAEDRRTHLRTHLAQLDAGLDPTHDR